MTERAPKWRLIFFLMASFLVSSCSPMRRANLDEEKEPQFLEGQKRERRMNYDGAIESFEKALQANPRNAAAHFELGVLYDQKRNDYGAAIYHYERHLMYCTNSPMADIVRQGITGCTRELAKSVEFAVLNRDVQRDFERMAQTNSLLKARVEFLETELSRRPQYVTNTVTNFVAVATGQQRSTTRLTETTQSVPPPGSTERTVEAPPIFHPEARTSPKPTLAKIPASTARHPGVAPERRPADSAANASTGTRSVHTVRPGETLATLASKYGVSLTALKAANPNAAGGVRAGQTINIPK